jgi:hypothetical protein
MMPRPFRALEFPEAVKKLAAIDDAVTGMDTALLIADEFLIHRTSSPTRQKKILNAIAELPLRVGGSGLIYEDWLNKARAACQEISAKTHGRPGVSHKIYVILIIGYGANGMEPGLYVGETSRRLEIRFRQHADGGRLAARGMQKRAICLLPSFYEHLNPLSRSEAKRLEFELANKLRDLVGPLLKKRIKGPKAPPKPKIAKKTRRP